MTDNSAWDEMKAAGRSSAALTLALAATGRLSDGAVRCPSCDKVAPLGKFKMHADGGWKHFSSQGCYGDAHSVLTLSGVSFPEAVRFLAGQSNKSGLKIPENLPTFSVSKFVATTDPEVLNGVLIFGRRTGGDKAAAEFYAQWHISPEAVAESGAVMLADTEKFASAALERFGSDRLVAAGLFVDTPRGARPIPGESFPVVEPHIHPATKWPTYLQFRASAAQYARYKEHKAGRRPYQGSEKFLSQRGCPREQQLGIGLPRLASLPADSKVFIVEGFKDHLAARTLEVEAYGVPGVDFRPPPLVLDILARHEVVVSLDGDDAGSTASEKLVDYLLGKSIRASAHSPRPGHDITDSLVRRFALAGHDCAACVEYRERFPAE